MNVRWYAANASAGAVQSFYGWLHDIDRVEFNPIRKVKIVEAELALAETSDGETSLLAKY